MSARRKIRKRINGKTFRLSTHHRRPKSKGGSSDPDSGNLIRIAVNLHEAWHTLVGNEDPPRIAEILDRFNRIYLDPNWKLIAVKRT